MLLQNAAMLLENAGVIEENRFDAGETPIRVGFHFGHLGEEGG
jgi:hypothetical protein